MKVYVLSEYYDNCEEFDSNVSGDVVLGVYSSYDKAKKVAFEFTPHSFKGSTVTEIKTDVHICNGTVRELREFLRDGYQYDYELYITEMEMDMLPKVD